MSTQQHNINVVVTEQGLDAVSSSMSNFASTSGTVVKSQDALATSMGNTQGAAIKTGKEFQNVDKAQTQTAKSSGSLGQAFKSSALQLTAFVSGLISTVMQVNSVLAAENKLDKQRELLNKKTLALQAAELKYNAGLASGALTGEKARIAAEKLDSMRNILALDTEKLELKEQAHAASLTQLALSAIPTVISGASSIAQIYNTLKGTFDTATASTDASAESFDSLGTAADTATTTGLIPTAKQILTMIPGVDRLAQAVGIGRTDGLSGALANNGVMLAEHNKFSNVFVNAFKNMGSAIKDFASNIKTDMGNANGVIDKIKAGFMSFFSQIGVGFTGLGTSLKNAGTAIKGFATTLASAFLSNPILGIITAIGAAIVGLIFNVGGFRDRLNELGVTLGKMAPWAKPFLDVLGFIGEKFAEVGDWIMGTDHLASATTAAGQAARKAADDFDTHFKAIQKSFIVSQDFAKFEGIVQNLKNTKAAIAEMVEETNVFGTTTVKNLGAATNAFELFNSGIVKGVPEVDAKVKEIQATFEGMRLKTISLADGQKILGVQLGELDKLLTDNINTSGKKIAADKESALAIKGSSDAMTNAEKVITGYNADLKASESIYNDFVKAYVQGNFKIIDAMGLTDEEMVQLTERFKKDFPDGAVAVQKGGEVIIKSVTDINKQTAVAVKEMDTVFKDLSKTITDNLPPSLLDVQIAIHNMSQEELLAKDISKLASEGITQDKAKLAAAVMDLTKKYGLSKDEATKALKDIQTETDNLTKTQDNATKKTDELLAKIQNMSQTRMDEAAAAKEQTAAANDLVNQLGIEVNVAGMTAEGLLKLVDIHDDLANASSIAADNVGIWYAELTKSQAIEKQEILTLETLGDTLGIDIPAAILSKGIPAVKAYIESIIGIGEGAKKAREEAIKAFNDLHAKAQSALSGVISDALGEGGDEIKKALKGIEKVGVSILALDAQSAIIDIFLNDSDYTNKIQTLDEIYAKEFGEISNLSKEQGTIVGDKFIQSAIDALGAKGSVVGQNMEAIWNEIKASSTPTDTGNVLIGKLKAALERKDLILAAMQQGVLEPVKAVMGLTDQEASALAKNIPANLASVLNAGKGAIDSAAKTGLKDPVTQNVSLIPNEADTALAPVEGIFSAAFLKASVASTGVLNSLFASIYDGMGHMITNTTAQLEQILSAWNDHAINVGVAVENIKLQIITLQQTYSNLSINLATYTKSMNDNISNWGIVSITSLSNVSKQVLITQGVLSDLSKNVATYMSSMTKNIGDFGTKSSASFKQSGDAAFTAQGVMSKMSTSVATYMSSMTTHVNNFANACVTAFGKVGKAADEAAKKVAALQKAIDALKDKTVTITTVYVTKGSPGGRFGASMIGYARGGDSWIQDKPGKVGGMNVGEFSKPELITVTPLTNPYDVQDKTIGLGGGANKGGGGTPILVTGNLYVTVQTQSGEVLATEVKPFLLKGFSGIT